MIPFLSEDKNLHDDVIKWKHFPRNWPFVRKIHRSPVNFPHKGQWRGALMFSLIYVWINDWANNREAGDLRRQHGHYDVIVMFILVNAMAADVSAIRGQMINSNSLAWIFKAQSQKGQKKWLVMWWFCTKDDICHYTLCFRINAGNEYLFLTWHNGFINDDKKQQSSHIDMWWYRSMFCITGPLWGESTDGFPAYSVSDVDYASEFWCHHTFVVQGTRTYVMKMMAKHAYGNLRNRRSEV